ncbi:MAG: tyrosine-type recombinase/integrase [Candidatus Cybelea sp.]
MTWITPSPKSSDHQGETDRTGPDWVASAFPLTMLAPKNGKARTIALPAPVAAVLEEHRERQNQERKASDAYKDDDLVFARPDGSFARPWNYAATVKDLALRAGLKRISLHDLRDTHASLLAANGVPLEVVSKRLGHSSIGVTAERYLHIYSDRDAAAASVLDTLCG